MRIGPDFPDQVARELDRVIQDIEDRARDGFPTSLAEPAEERAACEEELRDYLNGPVAKALDAARAASADGWDDRREALLADLDEALDGVRSSYDYLVEAAFEPPEPRGVIAEALFLLNGLQQDIWWAEARARREG